MKRSQTPSRHLLWLALCATPAAALGCADDSPSEEHDHEHSAAGDKEHSHSDAGTSSDAITSSAASQSSAAAPEDSLYLIATSFTAGDQTETYLVTTNSWDADTKVNPTEGPKLLGGVVPIVHKGSVFVPDANSPVMQRYDVDEDDKLTLTDEFSFMSAGVSSIASWHIWIVSDDKGYVFDPAGPRIVVWDPSAMELTGTEIDLSEISRDGLSANLVFEHSGPQRVGDQLYVPLSWSDQDGNSLHATGLVVLNTQDDSVVAVEEDDRCGEAYASIVDPQGNIYFFPPDWSSVAHFYADKHAPTCVLRITQGSTKFDQDYSLDLSALGAGGAAAGAIPDGDKGFFFISVDDELYDDGNNESGEYWRMYHYDFSTEKARELDSFPVWAGQNYWVNVGGHAMMPYWRETDSGWVTTMYSVEGSRDPEPVFSFDASWYGAAKLR